MDNKKCVCTLFQAGADATIANDFNNMALHYAALKGHNGCLQTLLSTGADVNDANYMGCTALFSSAFQWRAC